MKAQDFLLITLAFLITGLLVFLFQYCVVHSDPAWVTFTVVWTTMLCLAIGFLIVGGIRKLIDKLIVSATFSSSQQCNRNHS